MSDSELKGAERRQNFRIDMEEELIDIIWQDETGKEAKRKITCLDFSRGGVRADCDIELPKNAVVTVIFQAAAPSSQRLQGKVIRCIKRDDSFYEIALKLVD
jgi:c-di-GMP-binding flagellar brake protein YcgR